MNYLHVMEVLSKMECKIVQSKLMTYTKHFQEKEL